MRGGARPASASGSTAASGRSTRTARRSCSAAWTARPSASSWSAGAVPAVAERSATPRPLLVGLGLGRRDRDDECRRSAPCSRACAAEPLPVPDVADLALRAPRVGPAPVARAPVHRRHPPTAPPTPTARPTATWCAPCSATARPPARPRRATPDRGRGRRRAGLGPSTRASPSSPTAAAPRWSAAWSTAATPTRRRVSLDLTRLDRVLEVDRDEPRRPHPGRRARAGAGGAAARRTASRCATSRRASSSPRSAAGSPPAPAATTPPAAHPHRRLRRVHAGRHPVRHASSPGGCPAPARARRPTGCSSARRASSASSPRRGCACRTAPTTRPPRRVPSPTSTERHGCGARDRPVRPAPRQLPPARSGRGRLSGASATARACWSSAFESADGVPVGRPLGTARWTWRPATAARATNRARRPRAADDAVGRLALRVPAHALPARRPGPDGGDRRDLRDRDHLGPGRRPLRRRPHARWAEAIAQVAGHRGIVNCRLTHVYPDGAAPYFTVLAAGRPATRCACWDDLKAAASDVLAAAPRHHHPPPRRRPRPPPGLRPPAARALRPRAARGQGRARPGRNPQPRRADRATDTQASPPGLD